MDTSFKSNKKVRQPLAGLISGKEACRDRRAATQNKGGQRLKQRLKDGNPPSSAAMTHLYAGSCLFSSPCLPSSPICPSSLRRLLKLSCFSAVVSLRRFSSSLPLAFMLQAIRTKGSLASKRRPAFPDVARLVRAGGRRSFRFGSLAQPNDNRSDPRAPERWRR